MYEIHDIDIDRIDVTHGEVEYEEAFLEGFAQSIKDEGLHHAIVVRPSPTSPDRFDLVVGRLRLAAFKHLKRKQISTRIVRVDDDDLPMFRESENLFRRNVSKYDWLQQLRRWWEYYVAKHPEAAKPGAAGGKAKAAKAAKAAAAQ